MGSAVRDNRLLIVAACVAMSMAAYSVKKSDIDKVLQAPAAVSGIGLMHIPADKPMGWRGKRAPRNSSSASPLKIGLFRRYRRNMHQTICHEGKFSGHVSGRGEA